MFGVQAKVIQLGTRWRWSVTEYGKTIAQGSAPGKAQAITCARLARLGHEAKLRRIHAKPDSVRLDFDPKWQGLLRSHRNGRFNYGVKK